MNNRYNIDLVVGDILTCKCDMLDWFEFGKEYEFLGYSSYDDIIMVCNDGEHIYFSIRYYDSKFLWDYFYTQKESKQRLRKLKLERIGTKL